MDEPGVKEEKDIELKEDFSNLYQIDNFTLKSLKNDGIPHPEIPEDYPTNHAVEFGLSLEEKGKRRIRGVLVEYEIREIEGESKKVERRLFFETDIIVF